MKINALIKSNGGHNIVLDEKPELTYYRSKDMIIGMDDTCTFLDLLYYEDDPYSQAFGGHTFNIILDTGEIVHCNGQWWSGGREKAERILGEKIVCVVYRSVEELKNCYVFTGGFAIQDNLKELINSFDGPTYDYWEYNDILRGLKKR